MQLVYFSHSYRDVDSVVVRFFGELMRVEGLVPSLDPPSNRLNSAKPERHLGATDGMVAVLTARADGVSPYMLYEISLCLRTQKPLLVFVEDVLPNNLVPTRVLQQRFSRRGLLRQVRNHRHALCSMKSYLGDNPPPAYDRTHKKRSGLLVGLSSVPKHCRTAIATTIENRSYDIVALDTNDGRNLYNEEVQEAIATAAIAICVVDSTDRHSHFIFGALRAFLVPTILLAQDAGYQFDKRVPLEYQPRIVDPTRPSGVRKIVETEMDIAEEEYVDLEDQDEVARYTDLMIREATGGVYTDDLRRIFIKELVHVEGGIIMSQDNININNQGGNVVVKSTLTNVTQSVASTESLSADRRKELQALLAELQVALESLPSDRHEDAERVAKSAEMAVAEGTKESPNTSFLNITAEGLKEAAKAVVDIVPTVVSIAGRIVTFLTVGT